MNTVDGVEFKLLVVPHGTVHTKKVLYHNERLLPSWGYKLQVLNGRQNRKEDIVKTAAGNARPNYLFVNWPTRLYYVRRVRPGWCGF